MKLKKALAAVLSTAMIVTSLPTAAFAAEEEPYRFLMVSDTHVKGDENDTSTVKFRNILEKATKTEKMDTVVVVGDCVDGYVDKDAREKQYERFEQLIQDSRVTLYAIPGNHEMSLQKALGNSQYEALEGYTTAIAAEQFRQMLAACAANDTENDEDLCFSTDIGEGENKIRVIGLGDEKLTNFERTDEKLAWLEKELLDAVEKNGMERPIFVCMHGGFRETVGGTRDWYAQRTPFSDKLTAILDKFPNVCFFSGHSHQDMYLDDSHAVDDETGINYFNTASTWYLFDELSNYNYSDGNIGIKELSNEDVQKSNSEGYYVSIYSDKVELSGQNFKGGADGEYEGNVDCAQFTVNDPNLSADTWGELSVKAVRSGDGYEATATVTDEARDAAKLNYIWMLDGEPVIGENDATISVGAADMDKELSVIVMADGYSQQLSTTVDTPEEGDFTVHITGTAKAGATLKAEVSGEVSEGATYEWKLDGETVGTDTTYTVPGNKIDSKIELVVTDGEKSAKDSVKVIYMPFTITVDGKNSIVTTEEDIKNKGIEITYNGATDAASAAGSAAGLGYYTNIDADRYGKKIWLSVFPENRMYNKDGRIYSKAGVYGQYVNVAEDGETSYTFTNRKSSMQLDSLPAGKYYAVAALGQGGVDYAVLAQAEIVVHDHEYDYSKAVANGDVHEVPCTFDGCDAVKEEAHEFGAWEIDSVATEFENGSEHRTCEVCGYKETRVRPNSSHKHTAAEGYEYDADSHWQVCELGDGYILNQEAHKWDNGTVTTEPTATTAGEKKYTCTVCGATKTETMKPTSGVTGAKYTVDVADYVLYDDLITKGVDVTAKNETQNAVENDWFALVPLSVKDNIITKDGKSYVKQSSYGSIWKYAKECTSDETNTYTWNSLSSNGSNTGTPSLKDGWYAAVVLNGSREDIGGAAKYYEILGRKDFYCHSEHKTVDNVKRPATCTTDGVKDIVCSVCNEIIESNVEIPATGHDYSYSVDTANRRIVQTCKNCKRQGDAVLTASLETPYTGEAKALEVIRNNWDDTVPITLSYKDANGTVSAEAVNAGTYTVTATAGKASVTGKLTIKPADLTAVSVAQEGALTYTGEEQVAAVKTGATAVNDQTVTFLYSATEDGEFTAEVPAFTTAGEHTVYYKATAPNHNDSAVGSFTVTIGKAAAPALVVKSSDSDIRGAKTITITVKGAQDETLDGITLKGTNKSGAEVSGIQNNGDGTFTVSLPNATDEYTFTANVKDDTNYQDSTTGATCEVSATRKKSSSSSSDTAAPTYGVSTGKTENGKISVTPAKAEAGEKVTIKATPDSGYQLDKVTVKDKDNSNVKLTKVNDDEYTFTMPKGKVSVDATFVQKDAADDNSAAEKSKVIKLQIGSRIVNVDNEAVIYDAAPVIRNDRTLVPIRIVTETLGGKVDWNGVTKEVTLHIDGKEIKMTVGKTLEKYGVAPVIIDGRTFVPVRFVADELGATVAWDNATKTVTITKIEK